jgi:hypothetical protein
MFGTILGLISYLNNKVKTYWEWEVLEFEDSLLFVKFCTVFAIARHMDETKTTLSKFRSLWTFVVRELSIYLSSCVAGFIIIK